MRGDLVDALERLLRALDNGRATFRRVIVETTGLADPAPVLHTAMLHPYLVMRYRLDGVVTVVDAVNGAATLDAHVEAVKQAAVADRLVLTKTELPEPPGGRPAAGAARRGGSAAPAAASPQPGGPGPRRASRRSDGAKPPRLRSLRSGAQNSRRETLARGRSLRVGARSRSSSARPQPARRPYPRVR